MPALAITVLVTTMLSAAAPAGADDDTARPLSLADAVRLALDQNPALRAASAAADAAAGQVAAARAPLLPRLDLEHRVARGDDPVYVFSSLLGEGRFEAANFARDALNSPEPHTTHETRLRAQATLFAGGRNLLEMRLAEHGRDQATQELRAAHMATLAAVADAYYGVAVAEQAHEAHRHAVTTAASDLERARARVAAGLTTAIDTLSLAVHMATLEAALARAESALELARGQLNAVLGEPLDRAFRLTSPLTPTGAGARPTRAITEQDAMRASPRALGAALALASARAERKRAQGSFLPSASADASYAWDQPALGRAARGHWVAGVSLRLNLFNGGADLARLQTAHALERMAEATLASTVAAVQLAARTAWHQQTAAEAAGRALEAAVAQAEESHRLVAERYAAGLATVTDVLRSQDAILDATTRRIAAHHELRQAAIAVEQVRGVLAPESEVLTR